MARDDLSCPICHADVPLSGEEKKGDEVFCTYCGAPLKLAGRGEDAEELELEEDY